MSEIKNNFWRYSLGILIGMTLILIILCLYPRVSVMVNANNLSRLDSIENQLKTNTKKDTSQLLSSLIILRTETGITSEKVNSLNSRFNDFYIFTGIIITLLLAVNVSVYIRTDNEVSKHMKKNYEVYKNQITENVQETTKLLGEMQTQAAVANRIYQNLQSQSVKTISTINPA